MLRDQHEVTSHGGAGHGGAGHGGAGHGGAGHGGAGHGHSEQGQGGGLPCSVCSNILPSQYSLVLHRHTVHNMQVRILGIVRL